jgi:3-methylfumaryl-CoA hydratase
MAIAQIQEAELRRHIGRRLESTDVITPGPANLLRLTFARPEPELRDGDALPPGWQVLYFLPRFGPEELRPDGSPISAGVVPPLPLPRRMFAGERVRYHRSLRIGQTVRREIELTDMSVKQGGTGTLVFATTVSRIHVKGRGGAETLAIEEERRGVFREEVKAGERNQAPRREEAPQDTPWRRTVTPDAVALFRFSALTFNGHRIHSDRGWAMDVEGYAGLVVHGPFTATQLVDFARDHANGRAIAAFTAQARAPLFDTAPFELRGRPSADGKSADLWAVTPEGTIAVTAQVELKTKYARRSGFAI